MSPKEMQVVLRSAPFEPFRFQMTDGSCYDVPHIEMAMMTGRSVVVGVAPRRGMATEWARCDLIHVVRLEPLPGQTVVSAHLNHQVRNHRT
jgi:hypothetical protein